MLCKPFSASAQQDATEIRLFALCLFYLSEDQQWPDPESKDDKKNLRKLGLLFDAPMS